MDNTTTSSRRAVQGAGHDLMDMRYPTWYPSPMDPTRATPGPVPHGSVDIPIDLPRALRDWAKRQPEGVSALVRRLLTAEQRRRTRQRPEDRV